jgi:hypothetical protein
MKEFNMDLAAPGIEISYSKGKIAFFLILVIALMSYVYNFFFGQKLVFESYDHMLISYFFAGVGACVCIIQSIILLSLLFDREPALIINSFGIYYRPNTFISFEIPWNYIYDIRTKHVKSAKYPKLMVEYNPELYSQISFSNKLIFYPKLLFKPKSININVSILTISYKKLFNLLTQELEKSRQQVANN